MSNPVESGSTSAPWIVNTSDENFRQDVIERSHQVLVVVDFWAPWCGPCRMLTPILERLVDEFQGQFLLAKANVDEMPVYGQQLASQGIPSVYAIRDGRPVGAFVGIKSDGELRDWLKALLPTPAQQLVARASAFHDQPDEAERLLREALALDPREMTVPLALARLLIARERVAEAEPLAEILRANGLLETQATDVVAALELWKKTRDAGDLASIQAAATAQPDDLSLQLKLGEAFLAARRYADALPVLLQIVERDKPGLGQTAKQLMVQVFQLEQDAELVRVYRRRLSSLLH